jgi:HlyD family secretion protein
VVVELKTSTNFSGYCWTSGPRGPPISITSGTLCDGTITLTNQPPIRLVLPVVKKNVGF